MAKYLRIDKQASCVDYFVSNVHMFEYLCDKSVDEFCPLLSDVHNPIRLTVSYNNRNFESTLADHDMTIAYFGTGTVQKNLLTILIF